MKLPPEIADASASVQAHYIAMIEDGQTESWALMCALQQPPGANQTDRAFLEGRQNGEWLNNLPPRQAKRMLAMARSSGVNPAGKVYFGGIADKRGPADPKAWVSDAGDVKRVAEERGMDVTGAVNHKAGGRPLEKKTKIAKDILARETRREMAADRKLSKQEAREKARDRITPWWHKKGK